MSENCVVVARGTEVSNLTAFLRVAGEFLGPRVAQFTLESSVATLRVVERRDANQVEASDQVKLLISTLTEVPGVEFVQGVADSRSEGPVVRWANVDPLTATVGVERLGGSNQLADVQAFLRAVVEHCTCVGPATRRSQALTAMDGEVLAARDVATRRLEGAVARLTEHLAQQTLTFSVTMDERQAALDAAVAAREREALARTAADRAALEQQRSEFETYRKQFDDAGRTHKRRALMERLLERVDRADQYRWSSISGYGAMLVHAVCWTVLAGTGMGVVFATLHGSGVSSAQTPDGTGTARAVATEIDWSVTLRVASLTILFATTLIFYLRWLAARIAYDADVRRNSEKLVSDSYRAEWLAELVFEWREERNLSLPEQLVSSFTTGIFEDTTAGNPDHHPTTNLVDRVRTGTLRGKLKDGDRSAEVELGDRGKKA